jgi:serine/threonine protein kinase
MSEQLGQYRILAELGAGGMGIVYRALDTELQREVALKRLRSEFAASPAVLERFRNEAKLQGRLNHPNIAQLYSLVQTPDAFCIVMELVDGIVVKDLLPLGWEQAATIMLQALDALAFAHKLGVLHRDIKPENIIINRQGMVKVMDFGIAYAVGSERMTREKSLVGTIEYMSPERILGKPMDGRSDIYALGILLYELLSGSLPFDISNEYDLMRWHIEGAPPSVTAPASVQDCFNTVIQRAMAKDPAERYPTCDDMADEIRALLPHVTASPDALRHIVAAHSRSANAEAFDSAHCYARVKQLIDASDLGGAERFLRTELNRHPHQPALRNYHAVVSSAQSTLAARNQPVDQKSENQNTLAWLRLIAAHRASDHEAYKSKLEELGAALPQDTIVQLLEARQRRSQDSSHD